MGRTTISTTDSHSSTKSQSHSESRSQSSTQSQSTTQKVLDEALRDRILAGLMGGMTDEEIDAYAESLLRPQLTAQQEAAQQAYETARLGHEQEIADIAAALETAVAQQQRSYRRSTADVETAALARGMGRSSYTMETLAAQGRLLAEAVERLSGESARERAQAQERITLAAEQNARTQGRLTADYAAQLAAKVQELRSERERQYNSQYLSAVQASMGQTTSGSAKTAGTSTTDTTGSSESHGTSTTVTTTLGGGGSARSAAADDGVDAVSSAAPSVNRLKTAMQLR